MIKSIIPIVTKVKPSAPEEDFTFDGFKAEIEEIVEVHLETTLTSLQLGLDPEEMIKIDDEVIEDYE